MTSVLCTNIRIIDSTGAQPYPGEVLVQGNRISRVGRGPRSLPTAGVTVIDGAGATLMPARRAPCSQVATTASPSRPTARTRKIWSIS